MSETSKFKKMAHRQQVCSKDRWSCMVYEKCKYCKTKYPEGIKRSSPVCKRCEMSIKLYGPPTICKYCYLICAFIDAKCHRCTKSEKKYGAPIVCEICEKRFAFDQKDDSRRKVHEKILCWPCTFSYVHALEKASSEKSYPLRKSPSFQNHKMLLTATHSSKPNACALLNEDTSDCLLNTYKLKNEIANLKRKLEMKEEQMLAIDKQVAEENARHLLVLKELNLKIQTISKQHRDVVEDLQSKVAALEKQVITLSKEKKNIYKEHQQ